MFKIAPVYLSTYPIRADKMTAHMLSKSSGLMSLSHRLSCDRPSDKRKLLNCKRVSKPSDRQWRRMMVRSIKGEGDLWKTRIESYDGETLLDVDGLLCGANLEGAKLNRADLRGADLRGADLRGADLALSDLTGAALNGADLSRACLSMAKLHGADLRGADLRGADLYVTTLHRALLWGDLHRADLAGADLFEADVRGANLAGANLNGADTFKCIGLPNNLEEEAEEEKDDG